MRLRVFVALLGLALGTHAADVAATFFVSMPALLSNPERYDGEMIRVCGYYSKNREMTALYLHKEDRDVGLIPNSISVKGDELARVASGSYVVLQGRFTAPKNDRLNIDGGVLDVVRAQPLPTPVK